MDKAYEGEKTRASVARAGFIPVVPPKTNRKKPWKYDRELYKRRNEVERLFRKLKAFRRIYTRFDLPAAGRKTRHYVHGVCVPRTHPDYYLALTRPSYHKRPQKQLFQQCQHITVVKISMGGEPGYDYRGFFPRQCPN